MSLLKPFFRTDDGFLVGKYLQQVLALALPVQKTVFGEQQPLQPLRLGLAVSHWYLTHLIHRPHKTLMVITPVQLGGESRQIAAIVCQHTEHLPLPVQFARRVLTHVRVYLVNHLYDGFLNAHKNKFCCKITKKFAYMQKKQ